MEFRPPVKSVLRARSLTAAALAAVLGFASAPAPFAVMAGLGGAVLWSGKAAAGATIPGVGTIVKKHPGPQTVARGTSNKDGISVFRNLKPGEYEVSVGRNAPQSVTIAPGMSGIQIRVTGEKHNYVGHVTLLK